MSRKVFSFLNNLAVGRTLLPRSREIDGLKLAIFGETADREVRGRGAIDDRHNRAASFAALAGPSIPAVSRSTRSPRRTSTSALSTTFSASGAAYRKRGKSLRSIGPGMAMSWWSASRASQPTRNGAAPIARSTNRAHASQRGVDVFAWESFSEGWVNDIVEHLKLKNARAFVADYGEIPDLGRADFDNDIVFAWNGTTSGVRVPNADWIAAGKGLTICDATSTAFAQKLELGKARCHHVFLAEGAWRRGRAWHVDGDNGALGPPISVLTHPGLQNTSDAARRQIDRSASHHHIHRRLGAATGNGAARRIVGERTHATRDGSAICGRLPHPLLRLAGVS